MTSLRPGPHQLQGVPTLTEVIELPSAVGLVEASPPEAALPPPIPSSDGDPEAIGDAPASDEAEIVQHVLADLQRHADLMLEYRLREALAPVLARLTDDLVVELRQELAGTLRDVVARAVSQELARRRFR